MPEVEPKKDEENEHTIADVWRSTIRDVVKALSEGDYALSRGVSHVSPVGSTLAQRIEQAVAAYGEVLSELPDSTWASSRAQWMGSHWELIVDLGTVESGMSDLALHCRVFDEPSGYRFEIDSVHVP